MAALILHRAREAPEVALDQVEAGRPALREVGPFLLADDQDNAGLEQDAHRLGGHAGQVEHDLHGLLGLEHIDDGHALAGDDVAAIGPPLRQVVEQPLDVLGKVGRLIHGAGREAPPSRHSTGSGEPGCGSRKTRNLFRFPVPVSRFAS